MNRCAECGCSDVRHYASCQGYPRNFPLSSLCMYGCWTDTAPDQETQQPISEVQFRRYIPTFSLLFQRLLSLTPLIADVVPFDQQSGQRSKIVLACFLFQ